MHVLVQLAQESKADLRWSAMSGLSAVAILGRLFSVPGNVSRRTKSDVLIVHTIG